MKDLSKRKLSKELEEIKLKRLEENENLKVTEECRNIVKMKLKDVQQELLSMFDSYKVCLLFTKIYIYQAQYHTSWRTNTRINMFLV